MNFHPRSDWPEAAEIAKALGGKKSGKGYSCRCPAHNDKSPSLSVTDAGDGRVLLKCHTGCSQEDVMDALRDCGLFGGGGATRAPSGEWLREMAGKANGHAKPSEDSWGPWTLVDPPYDYTGADGTLLYRVVRKERLNAAGGKEKTFLQRQPDGTWTQGDRRVLYRWPDLMAHPDATLFVCEGEKDADRVASLGHCATTVANGNWNGVDVVCVAGRDVLILEQGYPPGAIIVLRHVGSDTDSLRAAIAAAAKLTVQDDDRGTPRFRPWKPFSRAAVTPPVRSYDGAAPLMGTAS